MVISELKIVRYQSTDHKIIKYTNLIDKVSEGQRLRGELIGDMGKEMDLESIKKFLEKEGGEYESIVDSMPLRFLEPFVSHGIKVDLAERGRLICTLKVPLRLVVQFFYTLFSQFHGLWMKKDFFLTLPSVP